MTPQKPRYFLDQDNSGHWYVIECARSAEWFDWTYLDDEDPRLDVIPQGVRRINGGPAHVTFTDPDARCGYVE